MVVNRSLDSQISLLNSTMALVCASGLGSRHPAAPENIVRDEKAAASHPWQRQAKDARVVDLIDVVEDDVVLLLLFGKNLERIADANRHALAYSGPIEVAASLFGVLRISVRVDDASTVPHRARPPDGGIADGRTHFKNLLRAADGGKLIEHPADGRAHDLYIVLARFLFHLR